jgi:fucose permease
MIETIAISAQGLSEFLSQAGKQTDVGEAFLSSLRGHSQTTCTIPLVSCQTPCLLYIVVLIILTIRDAAQPRTFTQ